MTKAERSKLYQNGAYAGMERYMMGDDAEMQIEAENDWSAYRSGTLSDSKLSFYHAMGNEDRF